MNAETQKGKILDYCEAFEKLYINSPTKRISELKKAGYDVQTMAETRINADGDEVRFKRYFISDIQKGGKS